MARWLRRAQDYGSGSAHFSDSDVLRGAVRSINNVKDLTETQRVVTDEGKCSQVDLWIARW